MSDVFVYQPPHSALHILYEDKDIVVVNKPSGLLTNPGRGHDLADSLLSRIQQRYPSALLVHRLDLGTSGVVVFALRRKAERELKQQFAERRVTKHYLAVVAGSPQKPADTLRYPLRADPENPPKQHVHPEGKPAITDYRVLSTHDWPGLEHGAALVELKPVTGRSHQLRVHMAELGHPILGDAFYAPDRIQRSAPRLLLHAASLTLFQPYNQQALQFSADTDFVNARGELHRPLPT